MKAVIVGAGVGGLAAALALARRGWRVEVVERAAEIAEVGAGLQISPNGVKALEALGLGDAIRRIGDAPEFIEMRLGRSGRRIFRQRLGAGAARRWGAPYLHAHRADLIGVLAEAVAARPEIALRLGAEVAGVEVEGPRIRLANGATLAGDVVIGADGVRSTVGAALFGPETSRFTGHVAWRAAIPRARLAGVDIAPGVSVFAGPGRHAVIYALRGGRLVNFVGIVEADDWREESWSATGDPAAARALFAGWAPPVGPLLAAADRVNRWALYERPPMPAWSRGAVGLLGDACHAMPPSLAQGATQAIEDAVVLAERLSALPPDRALADYRRLRIARVSRVQRGAWFNLRAFHKRGAAAQLAAYGPMWLASTLAPWILARRMDWLYGADVAAGRG